MERQRIEIFTPRYDGQRFAEHRLPIDLIEDLPVLKEMTIEMAKHLYREKNSDRERIPRNFVKGISFELEGLDEGSTIPKIVLMCTRNGLFPSNANITYFEEAKNSIINAIQAAEDEDSISEHVLESILKNFSKLGRKLENDERIEFNPEGLKKAVFTRETRKRIIQASSRTQEYTEDICIRGFISEMDLSKKTFTLDLINGQRLESQYSEALEEILQHAFNSFNKQQKQKILLEGTIRFDKNDDVLKIEETKSIIDLDFNDVTFRLEELALLKEGWFNGIGTAYDD